MVDMDLDDMLVVPTQGPSRPARFATKGSKFKSKPKNESSQSDYVELLPKESESTVSTKKEEFDARPEYEKNDVEMDVEVEVEVKPDEENENEIKEKMIDNLMEIEEAEGEAPDDVVREIDVYFAPSVDPNTRCGGHINWRTCEEVRVKPASSEFEVDLAVNFDSNNYDRDADPKVQIMKQLRPSMQHLKPRDSKNKKTEIGSVEGAVKVEESVEEKPLFICLPNLYNDN